MASSVFPSAIPNIEKNYQGNLSIPNDLILRHTYTTSQTGLTFPVKDVFVLLIGGGGGGALITTASGGGGGGGGGVAFGWIPAFSDCVIGAGGAGRALGSPGLSNIGGSTYVLGYGFVAPGAQTNAGSNGGNGGVAGLGTNITYGVNSSGNGGVGASLPTQLGNTVYFAGGGGGSNSTTGSSGGNSPKFGFTGGTGAGGAAGGGGGGAGILADGSNSSAGNAGAGGAGGGGGGGGQAASASGAGGVGAVLVYY